jgi:hypothetical protein
MKTRDEIIESVGRMSLARRVLFFRMLDNFRHVPGEPGRLYAWPEALLVITLAAWNDAWKVANDYKMPEAL